MTSFFFSPDLDQLDNEARARLSRYIAGDPTPSDYAWVRAWLSESPDRHQMLMELRETWNLAAIGTADQWDATSEWAAILPKLSVPHDTGRENRPSGIDTSRLGATPARTSSAESRPRGRHRGAKVWAIATLVCTLVIGALGIGYVVTPHEAVGSRTYRTGVGEQAGILLPDGSQVTLAPQTTFTVAEDFGRNTRRVTLTGEAYFDIASKERTPFVVNSGDIHIRVLGTTFDVRRYPGDREVRVAVSSGRVEVRGHNTSRSLGGESNVVLGAGMVARIMDSTTIVSTASDIGTYSVWMTGRLEFKDARLPDVLEAVGRWYGYEFRLADSLLAQRELTVTFGRQTPAQVMTVLRSMLGVTLEFGGEDGRIVTLHSKQIRAPGAR